MSLKNSTRKVINEGRVGTMLFPVLSVHQGFRLGKRVIWRLLQNVQKGVLKVK